MEEVAAGYRCYPRESVEPYGRAMSNGMSNGYGSAKDLPPNGYAVQDSRAAEDLKVHNNYGGW